MDAANRHRKLGKLKEVNFFNAGDSIQLGPSATCNGNGSGLQASQRFLSFAEPVENKREPSHFLLEKLESVKVHTIPTPHDSADGVVFVVENSHGLHMITMVMRNEQGVDVTDVAPMLRKPLFGALSADAGIEQQTNITRFQVEAIAVTS